MAGGVEYHAEIYRYTVRQLVIEIPICVRRILLEILQGLVVMNRSLRQDLEVRTQMVGVQSGFPVLEQLGLRSESGGWVEKRSPAKGCKGGTLLQIARIRQPHPDARLRQQCQIVIAHPAHKIKCV